MFSRDDWLRDQMHIASLPLAKDREQIDKAVMRLRVLVLLFSLCGLCANLPQALSQNTAVTESADSAEKDSSAKANTGKDATLVVISAARHSHAFAKPYGYYLSPILEHIQANREQREKITTIVQSFRGRIQPLSEEYRQKNQEFLANVLQGEHPETIMDEQTHLGRLYSDITLNYCQMSLEVRKVLNPEQIVRYEEFKRQMGWGHKTSAELH